MNKNQQKQKQNPEMSYLNTYAHPTFDKDAKATQRRKDVFQQRS